MKISIYLFMALFFINAHAGNLFVSIPTSTVLDEKYSIGFGVTDEEFRLKIEFGTQYNRGSFSRLSSQSNEWKRFHFSNYQFQKILVKDQLVFAGIGFNKIKLKLNNNNLDPEAYHVQFSLLKSFAFKMIEVQPELSYLLPISDKHDIFENHLKNEIRFEINLNFLF